jgi:hypothetical protein
VVVENKEGEFAGDKLEKKSRLDEKRLAEKKKEVREVQCAGRAHRIRNPFHSRNNAWVGAEAIIDSYQKTPSKQLRFHTDLSF